MKTLTPKTPGERASSQRQKPIRVTATIFGAGPGMGGTSYVEFRHDPKAFHVFTGGSASEGREELGTVSARRGWRGRVAFILDEFEPMHEDHIPEEIDVTGAKGVEAQMLALAWSGEAGGFAAKYLLDCRDGDLALLARSGAIATQECIDALKTLDELLDSDEVAIRSAIRVASAADRFDWEAALNKARRRAAALEQKAKAASETRREALEPLAVEIDQLVSGWWGFAGGASSWASQIMMTARQSTVRDFLEEYAISHGALPTGVHRLSFELMDSRQVLDLDVNALRAFVRAQRDR